MSVCCAIALGSNLGDSYGTLETAIQALDQTPNIQVTACSSWYRTVPIGPPQPHYLNGCALLSVELSPTELLSRMLDIEAQMGRIRRERWGARTLDLDLLLFDQLILDSPNLKIPHPRMTERAFVLVPLAEIAPNWIEPISGQLIQDLIKAVDCTGIRLDESCPPLYLKHKKKL